MTEEPPRDERVQFLQEAARARWKAHNVAHAERDAYRVLALSKVEEAHREAREHLAAMMETIIENHRREHVAHEAAHAREHHASTLALDKADVQAATALTTALADHHREHAVHAQAHDREHTSTELAVSKAETANDKRFHSVNEFREQLRDQSSHFASRGQIEAVEKVNERRFEDLRSLLQAHAEAEAKLNADRFEAASKLTQERYEANRQSIIALEKREATGEGKEMGRAAMVAIIVTSFGLIATVLGIIIVVANAITGQH